MDPAPNPAPNSAAHQGTAQPAPPFTGGFSADAVWVMIAVGLLAALAILWVVDLLGRRR